MIFKTILLASFLTIVSSCQTTRSYPCAPCGVGKVVGAAPDAFGFYEWSVCDEKYVKRTCVDMQSWGKTKDQEACGLLQLFAKLNCDCQPITAKPTRKPTRKPTSKPTRKPTKNKNKLRRQI